MIRLAVCRFSRQSVSSVYISCAGAGYLNSSSSKLGAVARTRCSSSSIPSGAQRVLDFWFEDLSPEQHFVKDSKLDERIRVEFGKTHEQAVSGKLSEWEHRPKSCLSLVIVLDQFSRNIYRDSPRAFDADRQALFVAKKAIEAGFDRECGSLTTSFYFYMPFMHSEALEDQRRCVQLFEEAAERADEDRAKAASKMSADFARDHLETIERFGRFPHRNIVLKRTSTPEEVEYLEAKRSWH